MNTSFLFRKKKYVFLFYPEQLGHGIVYLGFFNYQSPQKTVFVGVCRGTPSGGWIAWLVGVGKRAPRGFRRCPCLVSPHGSLDRLSIAYYLHYFPTKEDTKDITGLGTVGQGRVGIAGINSAGGEMRGVLLVPSSSPTFPPIYDGVGVNVTSNITWFHLNHDMVPRRIYKLSFHGGALHYMRGVLIEYGSSYEYHTRCLRNRGECASTP